jgi:hypothetical protein
VTNEMMGPNDSSYGKTDALKDANQIFTGDRWKPATTQGDPYAAGSEIATDSNLAMPASLGGTSSPLARRSSRQSSMTSRAIRNASSTVAPHV